MSALEATPLEELAESTTVSGETDVEAMELVREAEAFPHGVKTPAKDALTRALGRRGWAQRASAVVLSRGVGIARPSVALTQVRGGARERGVLITLHGVVLRPYTIASLPCPDGARWVFTHQAENACAKRGGREKGEGRGRGVLVDVDGEWWWWWW